MSERMFEVATCQGCGCDFSLEKATHNRPKCQAKLDNTPPATTAKSELSPDSGKDQTPPAEGRVYDWSKGLKVRACGHCKSNHLDSGIYKNVYSVACLDCRVSTADVGTIEEAIEVWNRRASDAVIAGLKKQLERAYDLLSGKVIVNGPRMTDLSRMREKVISYLADDANWHDEKGAGDEP